MPARKRTAVEVTSRDSDNTRRRSGRISNTPKKSSYWESSDDEETGTEQSLKRVKKKSRPPNGRANSRIKDSDEEEYTVKIQPAGETQYDGEEEDDEESEDDEDKPPKVVIIPLEKMRDEDGVPYEDHKLHKNTLLFLKDLKANNKRVWLKSHDGEYRRAFKDWQTFVDETSQTVALADETVPELPCKDIIFRIYRDTRFSKDPTPYKPHFSAAWSRTGRKGPYACYYIHCEPGKSFIGGGLWHPEASHLHKLRRAIDRHPERWREVFSDADFRRVFFPQVKPKADAEAVLKAFVAKNQSNALKKKPMGYDATHEDIELLKLKNYTVGVPFDAAMLCKDDVQDMVADHIRAMEKFVTFLNSIVMPDPNLDESNSEDEDGENDEDTDDQT